MISAPAQHKNSHKQTEIISPVPPAGSYQRMEWEDEPAITSRLLHLANGSPFHLFALLICRMIITEYLRSGEKQYMLLDPGQPPVIVTVSDTMTIKQLILQIARLMKEAGNDPYREWTLSHDAGNENADHINIGLRFCDGSLKNASEYANIDCSFLFSFDGQQLQASVIYDELKHPAAFIELAIQRFLNAGHGFYDVNVSLVSLKRIGAYEQQLLNGFGHRHVSFNIERSVFHYLELGADAHPFRTAVICNNLHLTYSELNKRANRIARLLIEAGAGQNTLVGLWMERSPEMMIAILGIWKAGAAYVPMDHKDPAERTAYLLRDARINIIITRSALFTAGDHLYEALCSVQHVVCVDALPDIDTHSRRFNTFHIAWLLQNGIEKNISSESVFQYGDHITTGDELKLQAEKLVAALTQWPVQRIGIYTVNPAYTILACLVAHYLEKEIVRMPPTARDIASLIEKHAIDTIFTESILTNRADLALRARGSLKHYLLLDEYQPGNQAKQQQVKQVWDMVAAGTSFAINDYGWNNSYTGEPFSGAEMKEYVDNFSGKLQPFINNRKKVLELGCGHGLVLFKIAPHVKNYIATDLTPVIIDRNKSKLAEAGIKNAALHALPACDIDKLQERDFDLIICSSVVHYFPDTLYLEDVLRKMIALLDEQGVIYLDDLMNLDKKGELIASVTEFKHQHPKHKVKTNWDGDLMVSPSFFMEIQELYPEIVCIEISDKLGKIENELTRYRYDVVLHIDKQRSSPGRINGPCKRNYLTKREWEGIHPPAFIHMPDANQPISAHLLDIDDIEHCPAHNISAPFNPAQIAYLIYTSGSTGKPKGAMVEHGGMMNHIFSKITDTGFNENDVLAQVASHTFDISIWQFFTGIVAGATTVIIPEEKVFHTPSFIDVVNREGITVLELVPSYLSLIAGAAPDFLFSLRYLFVTGEEVKPELVKRTARTHPWLKIVNAYGPTEASDDITHCFTEPDRIGEKVPVGKPLPNCVIRIVNERFELCLIGVAGEIWVAGICVGKGYLNEVEKTHEAFVYRSFGNDGSQRFYRTGDLGRWLYNGEIEFLHRKDEQVKIHGHRIELGEVENCLLQQPAIKNAVVILKHENNGNPLLCAFYEAAEELPVQQLRAHVAGYLPDYMIPALFKRIDKLPQTPNGKVDKKALSSMSISDPYLRFLTTKELNALSLPPAAHSRHNALSSFSGQMPAAPQAAELVLHQFNKPFVTSRTLFLDLFLQKVKTHADHVAVSFRNTYFTYSELHEQSGRLAAALALKGIQPRTIVAVCVERSVESIIALLGVIRCGAVYLFIEPSWPPERIRYVLNDAAPSCIVTTNELGRRLFDPLGMPVSIMLIGSLLAPGDAVLQQLPQPAPHDPAYIMYTSGSTGRPNGVLVEHRNLASFLHAWQLAWQFDGQDKLLLISSLTFDVSIADIGSALISGATIVICTEQDLVRPEELVGIVRRSRITVVDSVPSLILKMGKLIFEKQLLLPRLRLLIAGGDVLRSTDYNQLRQWVPPHVKIANGYGPTEATIYASAYLPQQQEDTAITSLSIGKPCANANIYIVDTENRLLPPGVAGELTIAGGGVARGYMNKVELTFEKFASLSLPGSGDQKVYRTGDYAQWRPDGCIEFLGRNDQQVKINGYRVGLPEIEKVLIDHPRVEEAVVVSRTSEDHAVILVAYIVAEERLMTEDIREHLSRALPAYMMPLFIIQLENMPLTANGKRDRRKLQQIDPDEIVAKLNEPPRNERDEQLRALWSEILGIDKNGIGPETDFFELGATSFEVIILASRLKEKFRVDIPVNTIFAKSKLKAISDQVAAIEAAGSMDGDYMVISEQTDDQLKSLFLFPPLIAYGFIYAPLKEYFPGYSLYAFNFIEDEDRIERYVRLVKEKQPHGPYTLMGYSAPGEMMAHIAASLEGNGEKVRLVFIDCARTSRFGAHFRKKYGRQLEESMAAQKEAFKHHGVGFFEEKLQKKLTRYFEYLTEPVELAKLSSDIYVIAAVDRPETLRKDVEEMMALPAISSAHQAEDIIAYINWEQLTQGRYIFQQGHGAHAEMLSGANILANINLIKQLVGLTQ